MSPSPRRDRPERRASERSGLVATLKDPFFGALRWIGLHVRGFYAAVGVALAASAILLVALLLAFAELGELVREGRTQRFDEAGLRWIDSHATPALDLAARDITALGSSTVVWMLVCVSSLFLWLTHHRWSVLLLWVSLGGTGLLNALLKSLFDRPRPNVFPWRVEHAGLSSFPSGHSFTATVAYLTIAYLATRLEPGPWLRRVVFAVAIVVVTLIGLSRMYLGVHYPTDVLAGIVSGLAWALFCAMGIEVLRYFRHRDPDVDEQEEGLDVPAGDEGKAPA